MIENIVNDINSRFDFLINNCTCKLLYRKYRYKGKFKKSKKFYLYNPVKHMLLDNFCFATKIARAILDDRI